MRSRFVVQCWFAAAATAALLASPARGQDVRYTSVSHAEFGGALGRWMKLFGGSSEVTSVTSIKGGKLRTDDGDDNSTVLDLDAQAFTWMDHATKTYMTMTFARAVERANAMVAELEDSVESAKADMEEVQEPQNVRYEVRFAMDRTGKKERIAGYEAEQVFFQVDIEAIPIRQPDETEDEANERAGTLVFLSDLWVSSTFPGYAAKQAQAERFAEVLGTTEAPSKQMVQAYEFDPRIKNGLEKLADEMQDLEGEPLRNVIHAVAVPYGVKFDRKAVLKDADKSLADDVAGAAANEAKDQAAEAVSGLTAGMFGKKKNTPPKPKQATIMRVREEVTDCSTAPLADSVFAVPPGYTERTLQ